MRLHAIRHVHHDPLPVETCGNCGQPIGVKEMPRVWRDTMVVCPLCHEMLQDQQLIFRAFGKSVPNTVLATLQGANVSGPFSPVRRGER